MKPKIIFLILFLSLLIYSCSSTFPATTQRVENSGITSEEIIKHIQFLASDNLKGRYPGTPGSEKAVDYIIRDFSKNGILPGINQDYRQVFEFVTSLQMGSNNVLSVNDQTYEVEKDFIPLGFSANGGVDGAVVFAGYGFAIDDSIKWNDYTHINTEKKWVIILRGGPEENNPHSNYEAHLPLRKKALVARDNKAAGVLFVSPINSEGKDELINLRYEQSFSDMGIPIIHLTRTLADSIITAGGQNLARLEKALINTKSPQSFALEGVSVTGVVNLEKITINIANVLGLIPGNDSSLKDEYIVLGAHFDHLGMGGAGTSSLTPDSMAIHNGADDNASGIAGLLVIGKQLASNRHLLKRSVLLMAYNAEEEGLLGSKYFVKNPTVKLESITTMINLDMIGRMKENSLTIGGTGTALNFEDLLNNINIDHGLNLKMSQAGYGPSDHASFYINNIPVLFFFSGTHEDYHKPSDDWNKINSDGEKQITDFIYDLILGLSNLDERPQYMEAGPKEGSRVRANFKVTLGVIPSYGSQAVGLEIDGTRKGGPAAKAGMLKGDIIVEIDGKEVKNIYDYMYRLAELKKGQAVKVKVKRGNKTVELTLQI